jgi:hypothetical protein
MFLHDVGHTFGALSWKNTADPLKQQVINSMVEHKFLFMGANRSMSNTMDGYGFAAILALLLFSIILWVLSDSAVQNPRLVKKLLIPISIILLAWGIIELIFFFPFAASFTLLAMVFTVISIFQIKSK